MSPDLGAMNAGALACSGNDCRFAGGARMELAEPRGDGPFYYIDGKLDPGATSTSAGRRIKANASTFDAFFVDDGPLTGASFVNVPEGEYQLNVTLPGAPCRVGGWDYGDPIWGFASKQGTIGVPILARHLTPWVFAVCRCEPPADMDIDAGACVRDVADASSSP